MKLDEILRGVGYETLTVAQLEEKKSFLNDGRVRLDEGTSYVETALAKIEEEIIFRQNLDVGLQDPDAFGGLIDEKESKTIKARLRHPSKAVIFKDPYQAFFEELGQLCQKIGREDITPEGAYQEAQTLEQRAGLKGVVTPGEHASDAYKGFVNWLAREYKTVFSVSYYGRDWKDSRFEYEYRKELFFNAIVGRLRLQPIVPVRLDFEKSVDAIIGGIHNLLVSEKQEECFDEECFDEECFDEECFDYVQVPETAQARAALERQAANDPQLRRALEEFLKAAKGSLRVEGNVVIERMPSEAQNLPDSEP